MSGKAAAKKKEGGNDGAYELEQNFILRLPQVHYLQMLENSSTAAASALFCWLQSSEFC